MDLGTYLDAQQRLLGAGWTLTYTRLTGGTYIVTASRPGNRSSTAEGTLSHSTVRLANRLARGAR
jgi:hypothetical protein